MLAHGQHIREYLRGVELVREPVPDGDGGVLGELLDGLLREAAVLYAVEHPREHPRRVGDGLLLPELRARGVEVDGVHAEVEGRRLKGAARAGRGLLENERRAHPRAVAVGYAGLLLGLELRREVDEVGYFRRSEVQQLQEITAPEIHKIILSL